MIKGIEIIFTLFVTLATLIQPIIARKHEVTPEYKIQYLPSDDVHGCHTKRVKVSYAPSEVLGINDGTGMGGFHDLSTYLPCTDCLLLSISGGLEFPNGSVADASSGMWLHHAVFVNRARRDTTCEERDNQRWFATGNERTVVDFARDSAHRAGYYISPQDEITMSVELMNMARTPQTVIFTMTYTYLLNQGQHTKNPDRFKSITPIWLDIGGPCKSSDAPSLPDTTFNYTCPSWKSTISGPIAFAAGHLHDGGTNLQILKNGDVVCESLPEYAEGGHAGMGSEHISGMSRCGELETGVGDEWTVRALYDTRTHVPMVGGDGELEPVMGIALLYVVGDSVWAVAGGRTSGVVVWLYVSVGVLAVLGVGMFVYKRWKTRKVTGRVRFPTVDDQTEEEEEDFRLPFLESQENTEVPHRNWR